MLYAVIENATGQREVIALDTDSFAEAFLRVKRESLVAVTPFKDLAEELAKGGRK